MVPINLLRLAARRSNPIHSLPICPVVSRFPLRTIHQTPLLRNDKDTINTEKSEYSKTGGDDATASNEEAAFDPDKTSPEEEKEVAGKGNEESGNPLDVSPANQEVSKPRGGTEGGAENSGSEGRPQSGRGSPEKGKKVGGPGR